MERSRKNRKRKSQHNIEVNMNDDEGSELITKREAADRAFHIAYLVARDILNDNFHEHCTGCMICEVIKFALSEKPN